MGVKTPETGPIDRDVVREAGRSLAEGRPSMSSPAAPACSGAIAPRPTADETSDH